MQSEVTKDTAIETLQSIRAAAEAALKDGVACICVTLFREHPPTGDCVNLCGHSGPRGDVLNAVHVTESGQHWWRVTGRFRAAKLITFCAKSIETILKAA
jgi:hypothetical protein